MGERGGDLSRRLTYPLEARCAGLKKGFGGTTDILHGNGTDMPSVKSTITAKLK